MTKIGILTCNEYLPEKKGDWYREQIHLEEEILINSFQSSGIQAERVSWSDINIDWASYVAIIFRSTWDYQKSPDRFLEWISLVKGQTILINSEKMILWNLDKHYLSEFAEKGFRIIPTIFLDKDNYVETIENSMQIFESDSVLIKPCISAGARNTFKFKDFNSFSILKILDEYIQQEDYILQPFFEEVQKQGEISHILIGGRYTHSVLKKPARGDFRVQDEHGGKVYSYLASKREIDFAESLIASCFELPYYSRVDCLKRDDESYLMELECIEPELFFRFQPESSNELVDFLKRRIL